MRVTASVRQRQIQIVAVAARPCFAAAHRAVGTKPCSQRREIQIRTMSDGNISLNSIRGGRVTDAENRSPLFRSTLWGHGRETGDPDTQFTHDESLHAGFLQSVSKAAGGQRFHKRQYSKRNSCIIPGCHPRGPDQPRFDIFRPTG
jgi:hypothetical protein